MLVNATTVTSAQQVRRVKDQLGGKEIPSDAYYGVQTARTLENFKLSPVLINHDPGFVIKLTNLDKTNYQQKH